MIDVCATGMLVGELQDNNPANNPSDIILKNRFIIYFQSMNVS